VDPSPSVVLLHRETKGLSALLHRPEQGIPVHPHPLVGHKDLAVPIKGRAVEVVLVTAARAFEK